MSSTTEREPVDLDSESSDDFGHLVSPVNQRHGVWIALCGKRLKGVRCDGEKPLCADCAEIRDRGFHGWLDGLFGPGWRN